MSDKELLDFLRLYLGEHAEPLAKLFAQCYPDRPVTDLVLSDTFSRVATKNYVKMKASQSQVPTYNYVFSYQFPIDDGRPAWHCSDIPFAFHNTDKVAICNKPGVSDQLEANMSGAFVSFATTGVPTAANLPQWEPCTADDAATMVLDAKCRMCHHFDDDFYEAFLPVAPDLRKIHGEDEILILH